MAKPRQKEEEMETTESYRGELRPPVRNVERLAVPANDNNPRQKRPASKPGTGGRVPNVPLKRRVLNRLSGGNPTITKGLAVTNAAYAAWTIIGGTSILYPVQFAMAALTLGGLGALIALDVSWVGYADVFGWFSGVGEELLFVSLVLNFVIGFLTFLVSIGVFVVRGVSISGGISIFVAAICLSLYAAPFLNFLPWMWLWCLYVVKSQTKE